MNETSYAMDLPVNLEGSLDPDRLPEITLGNQSLMASTEQTTPMMAKSNSGRMSPVRGRTMKEYDQQISDLKKENFSLKMRIYYMEERMQQRFGDGQDVFKTNIELQVEIENLKRELVDKQVLVQKAALAMETLTAKHEREEEVLKSQLLGDYKKEMNQLREQLDRANKNCEESRRDVENAERSLETLKQQLDEARSELADSNKIKEELIAKVSSSEFDIQTLTGQLKLSEQARVKWDKENQALTQRLKDLEDHLQDAHRKSFRKDRDIEDELEDQKEAIVKKDGTIADLERQLKDKDSHIGNLEDGIKDMENKKKEMEKALGEIEKDLGRKNMEITRYKKSIEGLVKSLRQKDEECKKQKESLDESMDKIKLLQDALKESEIQKTKALNDVSGQLAEADASNRRLRHQLAEANETSENLVKSLGKREGELAGFQEQLAKAMDALNKSEEALEALHAQLKAERAEFDSRLRDQAVHFQISLNNKSEPNNELEGLRQQIVDLQKLIASQNVELLALARERDVSGDLSNKLKEKDAEIEFLCSEHKTLLSKLEREIQFLKTAVHDRDMKIQALESHQVWLEDHQRETMKRMREAGGINLQNLSLDLLQDIKMLMDLLRREISSLAILQLQLRGADKPEHGINTEALTTEILSVQRIYKQLEKGVEKNCQLHQALLNSLRGDHRQSDSPDSNSCQDGGYNVVSTYHHTKYVSLSASPDSRPRTLGSPPQRSAKMGKTVVQSESSSSVESDWGFPLASHSVAVETSPEVIDRSQQTGSSFLHTDQWVQTSPATGGGDRLEEELLCIKEGRGHEIDVVSVRPCPVSKINLPYMDADFSHHYIFGHHNDSLTDDAKGEHLGLYPENLEDYHNFQRDIFYEEDCLDSERHGSKLESSPGKTVSDRDSHVYNYSDKEDSRLRSAESRHHYLRDDGWGKTSEAQLLMGSFNDVDGNGNASDGDEPDGNSYMPGPVSTSSSGVCESAIWYDNDLNLQLKKTNRSLNSESLNAGASPAERVGDSDDNTYLKMVGPAGLSKIIVSQHLEEDKQNKQRKDVVRGGKEKDFVVEEETQKKDAIKGGKEKDFVVEEETQKKDAIRGGKEKDFVVEEETQKKDVNRGCKEKDFVVEEETQKKDAIRRGKEKDYGQEFANKEQRRRNEQDGSAEWSGNRVRSRSSSWAEELEQYRVQMDVPYDSSDERKSSQQIRDSRQQLNHHHSRIPKLRTKNRQKDIESMSSEELRNLIRDLQIDLVDAVNQNQSLQKHLEAGNSSSDGQGNAAGPDIRELQEKLLATENTVRLLSKKNKTYLSALQAAGVPMTLLNRSSSENCLASVTESLGNRASSVVNLSTWTDGESTESIEKARSHFPSTLNQSESGVHHSLPTCVMTARSSQDSTVRDIDISSGIISGAVKLPESNVKKFSPPVHVNSPPDCLPSDTAGSSFLRNAEKSPIKSINHDTGNSPHDSASPFQNSNQSHSSKSPNKSNSQGHKSPGKHASFSQGQNVGKFNVDASVLDYSSYPDVTYTSMLDNTLMNRLFNNLDHNISALKEDALSASSLNMEQLQIRLEHLERVNLTLREEIGLYEALHRSQGTQVSPSLSEEFDPDSSRQEKGTSEEDLLKQHLIEIRKLRQRLERLDVTKDPEQLLIFQSHTQQRIARQETMIAHLQQQMVEKEEGWQRELMELQHRLSREKTLVIEKLEFTILDLQKTINNQNSKIECLERQVLDLSSELSLEKDIERRKEEDLKKLVVEKMKLETDLLQRDKEFLDVEKCVFRLEMLKEGSDAECRRLCGEVEERDTECEKLRKQLEESREAAKCLKETVIRFEKSVQEKAFTIQKLTNEKVSCDHKLVEKDGQLKKLEAEISSLKKDMCEMRAGNEEKTSLRDEIGRMREELKMKESLETKYEFQKVSYETEIKRITEEKTSMRVQLESQNEEREELRLRIDELEHKLVGKTSLENQVIALKEEVKLLSSMKEEIGRLNAELDCKTTVETELQDRIKALSNEVSVLKERLTVAEENTKKAESSKKSIIEDLKEREEKVKKRDKQLHHLIGQYKKLDAAFTKQKYLVNEKIELVQSLKKQMHLYEVTLTCASKEEKDSIMKQLLKELIATQRQVEDLLSRLEQNSAGLKPPAVPMETYGFSMTSSSSTTVMTTKMAATGSGSHHEQLNLSSRFRDDITEFEESGHASDELERTPHPHSPLTSVPTSHLTPHHSVLSDQGSSPNHSPRQMKYFAGGDYAMPRGNFPRAMVGSDMRSLFAVLKLDSHEKLRKETGECLVILSGIEARLGNRLKMYKSKSVTERIRSLEYSTLRESSMSCQNLRICLEEASRIISTAWITELPPIDARGHFYDPLLAEQNENLRHELTQLRSQFDVLDHSLKEQQGRQNMSCENTMMWEASLYKQLHKTTQDLEQAKENIDTSLAGMALRNQSFCHYSPQKSPRRRLGDTL